MDAQRFLAEFRHIASAPGGVQRLRELVLYLAIHGKLNVAHEAGTLNDAYELIAQTDQLKQLMREAGEARKEASLPSLPSNTTIKYPSHWVVARLGTVVHLISGQHLRPDEQNTVQQGIPYLTGASDFGTVYPVISRWTKVKKAVAKQSDILIAVKGTIGKINILNLDEAAIGRQLMAIRALAVNPRFIALILRCHENYFLTKSIGIAIPGISREDILHLAIGVPPLKEQVSIVAKVDELMALCDKLEAQQQDHRKLQNALRQSTLQAVAAATNPHELQTTWAHLAENFGQLFQAPEDVGELRNLVLELAIHGFLMDRHKDDEPAELLIDRSLAAKASRLDSGEMKRKTASATDVFQLQIPIPEHWGKAQLDEIFQFIDYRGKTPPKTNSGVVLITAKNVRPGKLNEQPVEYISEKSYREWMTRGFPRVGDLLITTEAPLGNVASIEKQPDFALAQRVINLQPFADINTQCAMYFMMSPSFQELLEINSTGMTAKGIKAAKLKQLELPVPPKEEQARIVERIVELMHFCDTLESQLRHANELAGRLAISAVSSLTGIAIEKEENEPMKAPQAELIAPLRLGQAPDTKAQAPLATILARHNGEMNAKDLWQRFGGEIDAFYAQLKLEVSKGWIREPAVAEMRVAEAD
ncbi:restriction endonuclease subunit S [Methylocaldum gracile]|jgi:type I restriction enzyme S subunit|uniref:restriction endonuclease subunit S n=1 Tax=Methylocaldum sp. 0917 TaxID=2485163 RepID=UPI00105DA58D